DYEHQIPTTLGKVFDRVGIDIVGPLPITSSENRYIIVATEYLTKWPEARAIKDIQANTVAQFIYEDIICRHGAPKVLLSDRGTSFVNSVVKALCDTMKTAHVLTTAYHPQTNGLTERFNKTLCETLAKYVIQNENLEWDQFIGEQVLLRESHHENVHGDKFREKWSGPYLIHQVWKNGVYKLRETETTRILRTPINGNRLKKYYDRPAWEPTIWIN
ncbi:1853_t:CDS:2, partial [Entrophospora sp. SA101]